MSLLQPKQKANRLQLRVTMPKIIVNEIQAYCQWLLSRCPSALGDSK
jgi:hypothetical protein